MARTKGQLQCLLGAKSLGKFLEGFSRENPGDTLKRLFRLKHRLFCFKLDSRKGVILEYTLHIFCWMHHGHTTCLPCLLWGDLYTKDLGKELSSLHFCKTKNQPGLTITEMGQSQKLSAECLFPSKAWWSGYKETEIQLILVLVLQKHFCWILVLKKTTPNSGVLGKEMKDC